MPSCLLQAQRDLRQARCSSGLERSDSKNGGRYFCRLFPGNEKPGGVDKSYFWINLVRLQAPPSSFFEMLPVVKIWDTSP